jgi:phage tail-like protein
MAVQGAVRHVELKHKFRLRLDGFTRASWSKMGELKKTIAVVETWEGGSNTPVKTPGRTTVEPVEVTRIAGMDEELYSLFKLASNVANNGGEVADDFKVNGTVEQLGLNDAVVKKWEVRGVWPSDFSTGEWDNEADEGRAQVATLQMDDWDLVFGE